jgi:transposase
VAECYVPPRDVRELRVLVRHRVQLVKSAGMVKNRVHSLLDRYGFRRDFSDLFGKAGLEWLKRLELKPLDRLLLDSFVQQIECLERLTRNVDVEIEGRASLDEDVRLLLSLTGVGVYSALLIKSEIGNIRRFPNYKKLVSWAGLAPSLHQSGNVERHGHITKQGPSCLGGLWLNALELLFSMMLGSANSMSVLSVGVVSRKPWLLLRVRC